MWEPALVQAGVFCVQLASKVATAQETVTIAQRESLKHGLVKLHAFPSAHQDMGSQTVQVHTMLVNVLLVQ